MGIFDGLGRWNRRRKLNKAVFDVARAAFPGGHEQYLSESEMVLEIVGPPYTMEDAGRILARTKSLMITAKDKSRTRIVGSMMIAHRGLQIHAANEIYSLLCELLEGESPDESAPDGDYCSDESEDDVIIINSKSRRAGIAEEYAWVEEHHGQRGRDWELVTQMYKTEGDRSYDVLFIRTSCDEEITITFDVTAFDRPGHKRGRKVPRSWDVDATAPPVHADAPPSKVGRTVAADAAFADVQTRAIFAPHAQPRPLSTDELIKEPLTTIMCRGTSHPCAVSVEAMVLPGELEPGRRMPVCMILLTPLRHWASEIGTITLKPGPLAAQLVGFAPELVPNGPKPCPRVLMRNERLNDGQAVSLLAPMVQRSQGASLLRDEIRSAPDDPGGRVEAYLAQCRADMERYEREGADLFYGDRIDSAEAEFVAAQLLRPSCMREELRGLLQIWDMTLAAKATAGQVRYAADSQILMHYLAPIMLTCRLV